MKEEWKIIKDFENYSISNFGNIKNNITGKVLKLRINKTGYLTVNVKPNGRYEKSKTFKLHREIAIAFIPNPNNLPIINHKDGNKLNNNINNLEWCTYADNTAHAYKNGLMTVLNGERASRSRLTEAQVTEILDNPTVRNIEFAKKFNIDRSAISKIRRQINWKHRA